MQRIGMAISLLIALVIGLFAVEGPVSAQVDLGNDGIDYNCGQFTYQEDAQAYFNGDGGSIDRNVDDLDGAFSQATPNEPDGLACDSLPSAGTASDAPSVTPGPSDTAPVDLPGTPAPGVVTIQALIGTDDTLAGSATLAGGLELTSGLVPPESVVAPGVTFNVVDFDTNVTIDRGTTDETGLVVLDGEYGALFFVTVDGFVGASQAYELAEGEVVFFQAVTYASSQEAPASVEPTAAPSAAASDAAGTNGTTGSGAGSGAGAGSSTGPSTGGTGTVTLPNTGTGVASSSGWPGLVALLAGVLALSIGAMLLRRRVA